MESPVSRTINGEPNVFIRNIVVRDSTASARVGLFRELAKSNNLEEGQFVEISNLSVTQFAQSPSLSSTSATEIVVS